MANTTINANGTLIIKGNVEVDATGAIKVPGGDTAQRPSPAGYGAIRYNSTIDSFEGYTSAGWGALGGSGGGAGPRGYTGSAGSVGTITLNALSDVSDVMTLTETKCLAWNGSEWTSVDFTSTLTQGTGITLTPSGAGVPRNYTVALNQAWLSGYIGTVAGDISGVTAGSGLTGGGTSGNVTINAGAGDGIVVNTDDIAIDTVWLTGYIGTTAVGGGGNVSGNGVSQVNTGTGLTGGPITTVGTVAINTTWLSGFVGTAAGDIFTVTAGTGLTGGGTSGNVTVNVGAGTGITVNADDVAIDQTWLSGYIGTTSGGGGGGSVTGVTANAGLTGGGTTGVVLLDVGAGTGIVVNPNNVAVNATWLSGYIGTTPGNVTITTGTGLTGGGTLSTFTLDVGAGPGLIANPDNVAINAAWLTGFVGTAGGDITGVTAGSGLTGGGTTGNLTVNVGAGTGITVNTDDVAVNTTWLVGFIGTNGAISDVTAGNGLMGGGSTGSLTLDIGQGPGILVNSDEIEIDTMWLDAYLSNLTLSSNSNGVIQVNTGTGLTGGPITSIGTVAINTTWLSGFVGTAAGDIIGVTAGDGLTGGGTTGTVTVNVGAGDGINVNANNVTINSAWLSGYIGTAVSGDITGITAGNGVTGGGTTGTLIIDVGAGTGITVNADDVAINTAWLSGYIGTTSSGDITGVTAGNGLTGGGTTGALTMNVGAGVGIVVSTDDVAVNTTWLSGYVGTIPGNTNITAGAGLTGGGIGTALTITVGQGTGILVNADDVAINTTWLSGYIGTVAVGDITAVTAGNGLTDGGTTGAVTVNVGEGTGIIANPNNVAINTAWLSGYIGTTAAGGTGDITSVVAGDGLTGGASSGAATVNVGAGTGIIVNVDDVAINTTWLSGYVGTIPGNMTLTAGTGLTGGGTGTALTVDVGAGAGINVSASAVSINTAWLAGYVGTSSVTQVIAGDGLTSSGTGTVTLNVVGGDGITVNADNVTVNSTVVRTSGAQTIAGVKTFSGNIVSNDNLIVNGRYIGDVTATTNSIDCSLGNHFTHTVAAATTFTFNNVPAGSYSFTLNITHTTGAITWPGSVSWPGGSAPSLTTGKTHLFIFVTVDGGTKWRGTSLINYTT